MKPLLAVAAVILAVAAFGSTATAQDPLSDSPLVGACHFAEAQGMAGGRNVISCRAGGDITWRHGGSAAVVPVAIRADGRTWELDVFVQRSVWQGTALAQR